MAQPIPVWSGVVTPDGTLKLDARGLFLGYVKRLANQPVQLVLKKLTRKKSQGQLGYLYGICYPVLAEACGYRQHKVDIDAVHDGVMRQLRGLKPEPNPLLLRVSLAEMSHEEVSEYIDDVRFWALETFSCVIPDPDKAEPVTTKRRAA